METIIRFVLMVLSFWFIWHQVFKIQDSLKRIADNLESGKNMDITINKLTLKQEEKSSDNTSHNNGSTQSAKPDSVHA